MLVLLREETEHAERENDGPSKLQGVKIQDMKMPDLKMPDTKIDGVKQLLCLLALKLGASSQFCNLVYARYVAFVRWSPLFSFLYSLRLLGYNENYRYRHR